MVKIYGDFDELVLSSRGGYLQLEFSSDSLPLERRWRNNGLSADFMADYFSIFFPIDPSEPASLRRQTEVKHTISYIANELLENAAKYSKENMPMPIRIALHLLGNRLIFLATNHVSPTVLARLQNCIEQISNADPDQLYIQQLERSVEDDESGASGLGFLSMMVNYLAKLSWKLEPLQEDPQTVIVTTMVELVV
ncbi:MAG: DUF6272 family protein [Cyanobacteria bacterium P01_F01_bin.33]